MIISKKPMEGINKINLQRTFTVDKQNDPRLMRNHMILNTDWPKLS